MEVGSIAIGTWVARVVFVVLVIQAGIEQRFRLAASAMVLLLIGWLILARVNPWLITPFIAVVDIGLVLTVLGRDVRLN